MPTISKDPEVPVGIMSTVGSSWTRVPQGPPGPPPTPPGQFNAPQVQGGGHWDQWQGHVFFSAHSGLEISDRGILHSNSTRHDGIARSPCSS